MDAPVYAEDVAAKLYLMVSVCLQGRTDGGMHSCSRVRSRGANNAQCLELLAGLMPFETCMSQVVCDHGEMSEAISP